MNFSQPQKSIFTKAIRFSLVLLVALIFSPGASNGFGLFNSSSAQSVNVKPDTWYRLKTMFRGEGESLEGNQASSKVHGGAAFMDKQQNVTGQLWKFVPAGNGYYRLKTMFRGDGECLEGNQAASKVHQGAAFMDKCQNVSGQLWKIVPAGNGYFRLKTQFRGNDESLEGNQAGSSYKNGAAFMAKEQNVSGQLWKFEEVDVTLCNGVLYQVKADKTIWQLSRNGETAIGVRCNGLVCNGKQLICNSTDGYQWKYNGKPNNWTRMGQIPAKTKSR